MIKAIRDGLKYLSEIFKENSQKIVIITLLSSLLFVSWEYVKLVRSSIDSNYKLRLECDLALIEYTKMVFDLEIEYNKKLMELQTQNKDDIIEYYKSIMKSISEVTKKQNKIITEQQ